MTPPEPSAATSAEFAGHVIAEVDTYGDPRIYRLAEDYLRLYATVDRLLPATGCTTVEEALDALGGDRG